MIRLEKAGNQSVTTLSNYFIDEFMPHANGEFIKIYIYLLRIAENPVGEFSLSTIADIFNHTEADVMRALRYWEKLGLLSLNYDEFKTLSSIKMEEPDRAKATEQKSDKPSMNAYGDPVLSVLVPPRAMDTATTPNDMSVLSAAPQNSTPAAIAGTGEAVTTTPSKKESKKLKPEFTPEKLDELTSNEDISDLLYVIETYIGKTLSPSDTNVILYFYNSLGFSIELIEYLVEYCVTNNHKSMRYIETVALSWAEKGIKDVKSAKEHTNAHSTLYYSILKSFGISGRNIAESEKEYIKKWTDDYKFSLDIILNACDRTISTIHQPSFQYADSILTTWKASGVHTIEDIEASDKLYINTTKKKAAAVSVPISKPKPTYSNFPQRSYDYSAMERDLLRKN